MEYSDDLEWYVLRVKTRFEKIVITSLGQKGFSSLHLTYLQKSRRKDRIKMLPKAFFPGYMFVQATLDVERHVEILKTIGVTDVLKNSEGPISVPQWQIDNILTLQEFSGKVFPTVMVIQQGSWVEVTHGPLKGLKGIVDRVNKEMVHISVDSIPGSVGIELNASYLEPISQQDLAS
ncbi:MAG: hypothetical protein COB67_05975 [SAR324 cluster bacterium]|uniref:NusG-like N-terminal domain-containing protein n=1 Tax=SAR324 cluster bacterium TaxID=2024889 RepID=A0A2A4T6G0_9DELT|nr:MAG: hypothetical protein COB67_05975 [SAR324 cluster bacterium]